MIFLRFGAELINLGQIYQVDLRESDTGVVVAFFYHLAGSTSGGYKVSRMFKNVDEALNALVSYGIQIKPVEIQEEYYDASQVPTGRVNTRIEPTRRRK